MHASRYGPAGLARLSIRHTASSLVSRSSLREFAVSAAAVKDVSESVHDPSGSSVKSPLRCGKQVLTVVVLILLQASATSVADAGTDADAPDIDATRQPTHDGDVSTATLTASKNAFNSFRTLTSDIPPDPILAPSDNRLSFLEHTREHTLRVQPLWSRTRKPYPVTPNVARATLTPVDQGSQPSLPVVTQDEALPDNGQTEPEEVVLAPDGAEAVEAVFQTVDREPDEPAQPPEAEPPADAVITTPLPPGVNPPYASKTEKKRAAKLRRRARLVADSETTRAARERVEETLREVRARMSGGEVAEGGGSVPPEASSKASVAEMPQKVETSESSAKLAKRLESRRLRRALNKQKQQKEALAAAKARKSPKGDAAVAKSSLAAKPAQKAAGKTEAAATIPARPSESAEEEEDGRSSQEPECTVIDGCACRARPEDSLWLQGEICGLSAFAIIGDGQLPRPR